MVRLENKTHHFDFELADSFFNLFPESILKSGKGKAFLDLIKSETMMQLEFTIELDTELTCDISLEDFSHQIETEKSIIVKFGEQAEELSEDVIVISQGTQILNVSSYIYEFLNLEVPMKKIHPKLRDKDRPDLVYTDETETEEDDTIDPRWEALKKLKE